MDLPSRLKGKYHEYFGKDYEDIKLHEEMLKDRLTKEFFHSIKLNRSLFMNKTIIDVNCGLGILSMLLASMDAKKVIGIESPPVSWKAKNIILRNNLENKVHVISKEISQMSTLPEGIEKVDILVSQWNGFLFFDKFLLKNLLETRDRWLKPEGVIYPSTIQLNMIAIEHETKKEEILDLMEREGFSLSPLKKLEFQLPRIEEILPEKVITNSAVLRQINLKTVKNENPSFTKKFELTAFRDGWVNAFVLYLDVGLKLHKEVTLSTSPMEFPSRWNQIVLYLENELFVDSEETIKGKFSMIHDKDSASFNIKLEVEFVGDLGETQFCNVYRF